MTEWGGGLPLKQKPTNPRRRDLVEIGLLALAALTMAAFCLWCAL